MKLKFWQLFLLLAIFVIVRVPFLTREFVLEEALHVKVAKSLAENFTPVVYLGEQQPETPFFDRPPTFFLPLAASFALLGESEITARIVPLLFSLGEAVLLLYFGIRIFAKSYSKLGVILAFLIFAFHPFVIQNSLQIHFDGAIYSFFSTLFLFLALDKIINKKNQLIDFIQLGVAFFFAFSVKYDPTIILIAIVLLFTLFYNRGFIPKFLLTILVSIFAFFGIFYGYSVAIGYKEGFLVPLQLIWFVIGQHFIPKITTIEASSTARSLWANNYFLLIRFLSWLSIPIILAGFYGLIKIFKTKSLLHNPKIIFLLIWVSFYCFFYLLVGWAGDYPRFFAPVLPALFLLIGIVVTYGFGEIEKQISIGKLVFGIATSLILLVFAAKFGFLFLDRITGWVPVLQIPFFLILFLGILVIFLTAKSKAFSLLVLLILIFVTIGQILAQYVHDVKSNYSLTNFYGVSGSKEAGKFLKNEFAGRNVVVFTYDPVAYYWEGKYYDNNNLVLNKSKDYQKLLSILNSGQISAFALPRVYYDELERATKIYGFNLTQFLKQNYPNYQKFGEETGTEVYY